MSYAQDTNDALDQFLKNRFDGYSPSPPPPPNFTQGPGGVEIPKGFSMFKGISLFVIFTTAIGTFLIYNNTPKTSLRLTATIAKKTEDNMGISETDLKNKSTLTPAQNKDKKSGLEQNTKNSPTSQTNPREKEYSLSKENSNSTLVTPSKTQISPHTPLLKFQKIGKNDNTQMPTQIRNINELNSTPLIKNKLNLNYKLLSDHQFQILNTNTDFDRIIWHIDGKASDYQDKAGIVIMAETGEQLWEISCIGISERYSDTATIQVYLNDNKPTILPNVFTPDGDGINDEYTVYFPDHLELIQFQITDMNGKLVYEGQRWNGTNGEYLCENGYYYLTLNYRQKKDSKIISINQIIKLHRN